jgi:cytochrome c oxidase subunit 2
MEKLLLILIIVLAIIGVSQIAKVYQLTSELGKKREEDISPTSNRINANLLLGFMIFLFAFFIWQMVAYWDVLLPVAASEHGVKTDRLFNVNWLIIIPVFFIVNFLLFFFAWKYRRHPQRKAYYLAHNNTLELIWTIVPSIVLAGLIIYGLITWNKVMDDPSEDALTIELYSKQFDWTARYPGDDSVLGDANFTMITAENPLGLITDENLDAKAKELSDEIAKIEKSLKEDVLPESRVKELKERIGMRTRQRAKVLNYMQSGRDFGTSHDDKVVRSEFHIPLGQEVNFRIRSRDVIHSAYMPHFRAQMNAVPGAITQFTFVPTITTDSMRTLLNDPEFNYVLLCNKVCGSAHYNMQMTIVVEKQAQYEQWIAEQKTFVQSEEEENTEGAPEVEVVEEESQVAVN